MRYLLPLVIAACAVAGCLAARAPRDEFTDRDRRRVVTVAIDHGPGAFALATGYDDYVLAAVRSLDEGDPRRRWQFVNSLADADVIVRHAPDRRANRCDVAGYYLLRTSYVQIDPVCSPGGATLERVVAHELLHWAGGGHICQRRGQLPDPAHRHESCSPVGYGCALLNPTVPADGIGPCAMTGLTRLDRAELARAELE